MGYTKNKLKCGCIIGIRLAFISVINISNSFHVTPTSSRENTVLESSKEEEKKSVAVPDFFFYIQVPI